MTFFHVSLIYQWCFEYMDANVNSIYYCLRYKESYEKKRGKREERKIGKKEEWKV